MLSHTFDKYRIILGSQSPRRQQLLRDLGLKFDVKVSDYDETYPGKLRGREIAEFVSEKKAESLGSELSDNEIVITADTIVWCNDRILGKPVSRDDAAEMISQLSGNTHEVITGVTLLSQRKKVTFTESTKVFFDKLSDQEIGFYIDNYKPYDKAGAYGIQEWIGLAACSRIEGSYFNVVGLPVQRLYRELIKFTDGNNT